MKGESDIVSGIQSLRRTFDHWQSFIRERPGSLAERMFGGYCKRLEWIVNDMLSCPHFPDIVREGIRKEWNADNFSVPAISEKVALLPVDQRAIVEDIIDQLISGKQLEITIETKEPWKNYTIHFRYGASYLMIVLLLAKNAKNSDCFLCKT